MTDQSREAFEAWFTANRGAGMLGRSETGGYEWVNTSDAWQVWQAAVKHERERCALVCEAQPYVDNGGEWFAGLIRQGGAL